MDATVLTNLRARSRTELAAVPAAAAGAAILALIGVAMAQALYRLPPSWPMVIVVGVGLLGVVSLALAHYEAAVVLGFLVFGVVTVEPAPPDGIFAIVMAVALVTGRFSLRRVPFSIAGLLACFVALSILSSIEAVDPVAAARFLTISIYLVVFSIWFTSYLTSERRARAIVLAYVWAAAAATLVTLIALHIGFPGGGVLLALEGRRAAGLFEDPNVFGPFLVPAALIVLEELLQPRLMRSRWGLKVVLLLLFAAGVLFSYSRAAWANLVIGMLAMLAVVVLRRGGGRKAMAIVVVVAAAAIALVVVISVSGSTELLKERAQYQSYDVERFGAQRKGLDLAQSRPLGVGPGQFDVLVPVSTHSTYVRALAEQGLLGLAITGALFLTTLLLAVRNAFLGRDSFGIGSAALLGAWLGLMLSSFVVDTLHWRHLWFVAALIWVGAMRSALPAPAAGAIRRARPAAGQPRRSEP